MKSLVINAGSSSVKFQLFEKEKSILMGICEEIGSDNSKIILKEKTIKIESKQILKNHESSFRKILEILKEKGYLQDLKFVVHRVVHGGEKFKKPVILDSTIIKELEQLVSLAPLHNPANLEGIKMMMHLIPKIPQVAVFDTSFHSSLPEHAYLYGSPYSWYKEYGIRKYGFHGSSHEYVANEAIKFLKNKKVKIISCHLGNGASICAIKNGESMDTSMGMTPMDGLVMGTRAGSIDPGIIFHLIHEKNLCSKEVEKILNKESGLKGLSGLTSDMRPLEENRLSCAHSSRAMKVYTYSLLKIIGSYIAALNGVDAIIFTGGAGEKSSVIRQEICNNLEFLGVSLNQEENLKNSLEVSGQDSKIKIFVIPTNEELQMVRNAFKVLKE